MKDIYFVILGLVTLVAGIPSIFSDMKISSSKFGSTRTIRDRVILFFKHPALKLMVAISATTLTTIITLKRDELVDLSNAKDNVKRHTITRVENRKEFKSIL
jgi:hypothetical protein